MDIQLLLQRMEEGVVSIDDLIAGSAPAAPPAAVDALWQRCALVRSFDENLYDEVLADGLTAPAFAELVESPDLESLPTRPPSFYVRDAVRRRCFTAWKRDRSELQRVSEKLVQYYQARSAPVDVFTHLIFAAPDQALADFERLYREADDRFDLAACDALLRIVRNRLDLIDEDAPLRRALIRREQYLRSRTLFADDYYRTVSYLQRESLAKSCEQFLTDPEKWIFHVHGKGGTGKTMFVRWLVARRCVQEHNEQRIPVARLDFDVLDLALFSLSPWLILSAIGEQLEQQMESGALVSFLIETREFTPLLRRTALESPAADLRKRLNAAGKELGHSAELWFISALGATPVVVVLDTIEEPLLHYKAALRSVLDLFQRIRSSCPGFRVVLSGRYNIADPARLPATAAALDGQIEYCPVSDFTAQETIDFLHQLRRVSQDEAVLAAFYDQTRGNPLEVSLLAELLQSDPSISTPDKVKEIYPIASVARLLDRIIKRIPDRQEAVRWLLRYAVVPRNLTRQFFDDVLMKHMQKAARLDAPNTFDGDLALRYDGQVIWKPGPQVMARIWKELEGYAGASSWIVAEKGLLRLQPEIVNPMRQLLREQSSKAYRYLHSVAASYFERRAKREKSRWAEHIAEAIYHRFQRDGRDAVAFWRAQLADPRAKDPVVRERLARVVLGSELIDDETLAPRPHPRTRTIVDPGTCARAAFEVSVAALTQRLRVRQGDAEAPKLQEQIAEYADKLERFHKGLKGRPVVPVHRRTFLKGVVAIYRDHPREGERLVRTALARETRRELRLLMELRLALTQRSTRPAEAVRRFEAARQLAVQTHSASLPPWLIDYRCGWFYLESLDFACAGERFGRAYRGMAAAPSKPREIADCLRRAVQAYLETGQLTEARRLLDQARGGSGFRQRPALRTQWLISSAQLALKQLDPIHAQRHVDAAREMAHEHREVGVVAELYGDIAAARLQTHEMEQHYAAASEAYAQGGSLRGQINCHLRRIRYYLEELGQGAMARSLLSQIRRPLDPQSATERFLMGARLAALSGTRLLFSPQGGLKPVQRARALATVISTGRSSSRQVKGLLDALAKIRLRTVRGETLREFAATDSRMPSQNPAAARLARLAAPAPEREEFPVQAYYLAAALRCFGADRRALKLLAQALALAKPKGPLSRKIRMAMEVLAPHLAYGIEAVLRSSAAFPGLRATILVTEAERCLACGKPEIAAERLARAYETLDDLGDDTVWHVRATELSGRLAELRESPQQALTAYRVALECARRGENRAAQTRLHRRIDELTGHLRAEASPLALLSPAVTVEVQAASRTLHVSVRSTRGRWSTRETSAGAEPNALEAALLKDAERADSPEMLAVLRGSGQSAQAAAREILDSAAMRRSLDLALRMANRSVSAFPWEIALDDPEARRFVYRAPKDDVDPRETVTWIQASLVALGYPIRVDGSFGPQTQAALRECVPTAATASPRRLKKCLRRKLQKVSAKPARVLVLRAGLEQQRQQRRGHGAIGLDVIESYVRWFGEGQVFLQEHRDPEKLENLVLTQRPTLIHIVTGFLESSSTREIHLDLARPLPTDASPGQHFRFTTGYFKSLLGRLARDAPPPFVFVEVILPDDDLGRARQVLLRNAFCAELLVLARTRGVLATGLFPAPTLLGPYREHFALLSREPSAGEFHQHVWNHLPAAFPPALFTADPDLPVLR